MRQVSRVVIAFFGIHLLFEQQAYLFALDMNGRHDDMAGWKVHQLQDAFTQIGFHYIYAFRQQERIQFAFFRKHGFAFDETGHLMFFKQSIDDLSVFFCVFSPMYDGTVCRGVLFKFYQQFLQMAVGIEFQLACFFPFGYLLAHFVSFGTYHPQGFVVPCRHVAVPEELFGSFGM